MRGDAFFRWLNVRKEERWLVAKLFWIQFFQGAGVTFFFTSAISTFLEKLNPSEDLPLVYICSSFLMLLTGYVYGILEHRYSVTRFSRYVILFMASSTLLIYITEQYSNVPGIDFFRPIWYFVLYLLSNLEFWGIASTVFEVRQSKRLFSVISAGDIPAKLIGSSFALTLVGPLGAANLLIPAIVCMLLSLPFLRQVKKTGILHMGHFHDGSHGHEHKPDKRLRTFLKRFTSNRLIYRVALLSFIMSVCLVISNFAFYSVIKEKWHNDKGFGFIIASFIVVVQSCALLVKVLLTSRIISRLGIKRSLLLTPVIFIILITLVIVIEQTVHNEMVLLYTFGITCVVLDVMKAAVNQPVFLSIMQPLGIHDRLRAHNIVKGIMDPFAYLFSGLFLVLVINFEYEVDLLTLSYCLLFFAFFWVAGIYFINTEYHKTLLNAISRKYYLQGGFAIDDNDARAFINRQLSNGSDDEVVRILQLLQVQPGMMIESGTVEKLFSRPSDAIKENLLKLMQHNHIEADARLVAAIAEDTSANLSLRLQAFAILSQSPANEPILAKYLADDNYDINILCNAAILSNKDSAWYFQCSNALGNLINSEKQQNRRKAAHIIGKTGNSALTAELRALMNDADSDVKSAAILAAGELADEKLMPEILTHLKTNRAEVTESVYRAGDVAVPFIVAFILGTSTSYDEKNQLIAICGRTGGDVSKMHLLDLLDHLPDHVHNILKAVYNCKGKTDEKQLQLLDDMAHRLVEDGAEILFMQKCLSLSSNNYKLLHDALDIELLTIRESLLYIFSMLYGEEEIEKIRRAIKLNNKESIANALELVEMTVPKKFAHDFNVLYEHGDVEQRCASLHSRRGANINEIAQVTRMILRNPGYEFNHWTKSCSIYLSLKHEKVADPMLTKRYILSDNPVLNETANFTVSHHMENKLLLLEKVLMLKKTAIFADTPENVLADLAPLMQEVAYAEGESIFEEGTFGDSMYIIYQGEVRIHKGDTTLVVLTKENEVFGELSLFDAEKRSASASAKTDCVLYKIDQLPFYELIEVRPEIVMGAIKILSKRLRDQNEKLVQMSKQ